MGSGVADFMPVYGYRTPPRPVPILDLVDKKGEREREARRTVRKEIEFLSADTSVHGTPKGSRPGA